jgi:hypothetical protein
MRSLKLAMRDHCLAPDGSQGCFPAAHGEEDALNANEFCPRRKTRFPASLYIIGVPLNRIFEHLDATIAEATPLYELCSSLLQARSE